MLNPSAIRSRWKGEINLSTIILAEQLCKWKKRVKELTLLPLILGIAGAFSIMLLCFVTSFNILLWLYSTPYRMIAYVIAIDIMVYFHFQNKLNNARKKEKEFKDKLVNRVDAEFCNCGSRCTQNHKEQFLEYMIKEQEINLYY